MTRRRSERELEREIERLEGDAESGLAAFFWADLVEYHGGDLTASQRRLLAAPEAHLAPPAVEAIEADREGDR